MNRLLGSRCAHANAQRRPWSHFSAFAAELSKVAEYIVNIYNLYRGLYVHLCVWQQATSCRSCGVCWRRSSTVVRTRSPDPLRSASLHTTTISCRPRTTMPPISYTIVKGKGCPYSITERRVPELIPVLGSQPADGVNHKPDGRLPLLSARPAVTLATLEGCCQFRCLVNRGTTGVNSLPKTLTRQRRDCDLNPGPSAPESSTLTTRLPSHPPYTID